MGLLKKLFGGTGRVETVRQALAGQRWAEALALGERIDREALDAAQRDELDHLLDEAGNGLAALNLEAAEACLRSGEAERAAEHLELAAQQARSAELAARIDARRQGEPAQPAPASTPEQAASCCASACGPEASATPDVGAEISLDEQTHLDLILATYPADVAERYGQAAADFKRAFLLAHQDDEEGARQLLEDIPREQRDDLFHFERGALLGRSGETEAACRDLEEALRQNPDLALALDALVRLLLSAGRSEDAERLLQSELDQGRHAAYCCARLAELATRRGDYAAALQLAKRSLEQGNRESETVLLAASLLEREGRLDEAEAMLASLGGGGCSGGFNVHLAEFSLRHRRNLGKALEAFKGAARQEPDEPRWVLRMAQVSLARGWRKDGEKLLRRALDDPRLDEGLRAEAEALRQQPA